MQQRPLCTFALALTLIAVLCIASATAAERTTCSSPAECCQVCGDDSYRCARGPCVTSVIPTKLFSISLPASNIGFWDVVLSFFGMVPFIVPIGLAFALLFIRKQRTWTNAFAFIFTLIVGGLNDLVFVKSLGDCAECLRPCGSCVSSNGMPSGHAANAVGLCLWIILETLCGVGRLRRWSACKRIAIIVFSILLFGPVPYSRVYVGDHKPVQVIVGGATGIVYGFLYFVLLRYVVAKRLNKATQSCGTGCCTITIINDFSAGAKDPEAAPQSALPLHEQLLGDRHHEASEVPTASEQTPVSAV